VIFLKPILSENCFSDNFKKIGGILTDDATILLKKFFHKFIEEGRNNFLLLFVMLIILSMSLS